MTARRRSRENPDLFVFRVTTDLNALWRWLEPRDYARFRVFASPSAEGDYQIGLFRGDAERGLIRVQSAADLGPALDAISNNLKRPDGGTP